jgi:hypothetical protein
MKITIKSSTPSKPVSPVPKNPLTPKTDNIITKVIRNMIDDITYRIYGIKSKDREKWEEYQKFAELAKGDLK